ncbi:MAG: glycoside hydrolase family 2 TIM barrel-domain containing protein, partial [Pirellulaceae bacterium]
MLVQQEQYGAIQIAPSSAISRRFDASLSGVMRRDRNHPSIVIWCLLNEMWDGPQFRHAVQSLPLVKHLDDTRLVWLGSGGFDMQFSQGSLSNPGAMEWQHLMGNETPGGPGLSYSADDGRMLTNQAPVKADIHPYQPGRHTAAEIER